MDLLQTDIPFLMRAAFHAVQDGVCLLDPEGRVLECNPAMARIFDLEMEHILGQPCYKLFHSSTERIMGCPFPKMLLTKRRQVSMLEMKGRIFTVVVDPVVIPSGQLLGGVHIMTDITKRRKTEEALRRSEAELRRLSIRLLDAHEEERRRVARDLHDGLGQTLSAIKFSLEAVVAADKEHTHNTCVAKVRSVLPMVQNTIEEVRRIGRNLRPAILDDLGILPTIRWLCREFEAVYAGVRLQVRLEAREADIPANLKTTIYRILQEGLHNIAKHSGAKNISLSLQGKEEALLLRIKDDGRGFHTHATGQGSVEGLGHGLGSMRERAQLSGGDFELLSTPGKGTQITVRWKLPPSKES